MYMIAVADAGFLEGGFWYNGARAKNLRPRPLKPRPFLSVLERNFVSYLSIHPFSIRTFAKVCHRSWFLSSSGREGVPFSLSSVLLSTSSSPKGGSMET